MPCWESLGDWVQRADYGFLLPALARLPLPLGETLAKMRGVLRAAADYEYRSLALRQRFVRHRTFQAMRILLPGAGKRAWRAATLKRFVHDSRIEWQEHLFGTPRMARIARGSALEGFEAFLRVQRQGRGLVLVCCHFDSFMLGLCLMGMHGLRSHLVTSHWVEDPRVHPRVASFFRNKFRGMESHMGGRNLYHERDMEHFYQALKSGEAVALVADVPGNRSSVSMPFLGRCFRMPLGAWRLAKATDSPIGAFVCLHERIGRYRLICLPPREIDPQSPENTMRPIYGFLEHWIRRAPERWIAADLLSGEGYPPPG